MQDGMAERKVRTQTTTREELALYVIRRFYKIISN